MKKTFYVLLAVWLLFGTTIVLGQALNAPKPTSPDNNFLFVAGTPSTTLKWDKNNASGVSYAVRLVNTATGTVVGMWDYGTNLGDVGYVFVSGLRDGQSYRWTVRAMRNGVAGPESNPYAFRVGYPVLLTPAPTEPSNGKILPAGTISTTLVWNRNNYNQETYAIRLIDQTSGSVIWNYKDVGTSSWTTVSNLQNGHSYQWSVRVKQSGSTDVESGLSTFSVANPATIKLNTPNLISPSNNQVLPAGSVSVSLQWNKNNANGVARYQVGLVNLTTGAVIWNYVDKGDESYAFVPGLQNGHSYRWVVRAVRNGSANAESGQFTFSVASPVVTLYAPSNLSPNNANLAYNTTSLTLNWNKNNGNGVAQYQVRLVNAATNAIVNDWDYKNVGDFSSTTISGLQSGQYSWKVRAFINGSNSIESGAATFTIASLAPLNIPTPTSPKDSYTLAAGSVSTQLTWTKNNANGTARYQVGLVNLTTGAVIWNYVDKGDEAYAFVPGLQNGHSYRWAVKAVRNGIVSGSSQAFTFSVASPRTNGGREATTELTTNDVESIKTIIYPNPTNTGQVSFSIPTSFILYNLQGLSTQTELIIE